MTVSWFRRGGALAAALLLAGCNGLSQGTGGGPVTGAAAGSTSVNAVDSLQRCSEPLGTLAVDDGRNQAWWGPFYSRTQVTSIEPMVRLVVQQSNCFIITSLGNLRMEDRIAGITRYQRDSGEFRPGSNLQRGQRVAADYFLEPAILFAGDTTSGLAGGLGGLGGLGGRWGGVAAGALGGALRSNSTSVTMSLLDIRSGVQVAASEGSSTATNLGASLAGLGLGYGGGGGGALSGFTRTPQGQATVAAFVDAYNKLVVATRNYRAQSVRGGSGTGGLLRVN
jgi:Curli production assembly/transport component CsgG